MKIAIVSPYDIHRPGGVQQHILDTARLLPALGHEVRIIAPGPAPAGPDDASVIHLGRKRGINFNRTHFEVTMARGAERRAIPALLARERFDVMHFHTIWTPILPFQILRRSTAANVATFHDIPPDTAGGRLTRAAFRAISRFLLPRLDAAITPSVAPLGHLTVVDGRRPSVLPPCTDLSAFRAGAAPHPEFRDGKLNILFLSRLDRRKGIYQLLQAYRVLSREGRALRLLIGGAGEEAEGVRRFIAEHALPDAVLLGHVARAAAPRLYASADVFCAPALYGESFGIVLVEAMASGTPVVAAANPGFSTVLTGEGARFLAPPGDAATLAAKLRLLLEDADLRRRMGEWGRRAAGQYDCRAVVPKLVALYCSALERRRERIA